LIRRKLAGAQSEGVGARRSGTITGYRTESHRAPRFRSILALRCQSRHAAALVQSAFAAHLSLLTGAA
jgi:hypothetical protein